MTSSSPGDDPTASGDREATKHADPTVTRTADAAPVVLVTARELRHLRTVVWGLATLVVVLVMGLGLTLPRSIAYGALFGENLELRERLSEIDRSMAEVDRLLLRLRLYDAQFRSLSPEGDHGPLAESDWDAWTRARAPDEVPGWEVGPMHAESPVEQLGPHGADPLRPAHAWAEAVRARVDTFLSHVALAEPDLAQVMRELEDLRALEQALPSAWPAAGRLTSTFGWRRSPFGRSWRFHGGLDIAARRGTPIVAPAPGRVLQATYNAGYGRMVVLDHGFGITTVYAHCHTLEVSPGDVVERGDQIATIGSTGRSTGPHLHFEVRLDGHPVDPLDYLPR